MLSTTFSFNFSRSTLLFALLITSLYSFAQNGTVRGTVRDENGQPLSGASVTVQGSKNGVVTDNNGNYSISVPPGKQTLIISFVGNTTSRI